LNYENKVTGQLYKIVNNLYRREYNIFKEVNIMISNLNDYLESIVIGIRYRANFSITDNFGSIIDEILYSKGAFFNQYFFPLVIHSKVDERVLFNKDNKNSLTINSSNMIIELHNNDKLNLNKIVESFKSQIVFGVMKKYKITQINRIGFINRYKFKEPTLANNFIEKTIGETLEGIKEINLQFSRKYTILEALVKKDTYDYYNAIYNVIKRADKDELIVSVDFQRFYEPVLESTSLIKYDQFIDKVHNYNLKDFLSWLNNNYGSKQ